MMTILKIVLVVGMFASMLYWSTWMLRGLKKLREEVASLRQKEKP
jgi:hypothetical protein